MDGDTKGTKSLLNNITETKDFDAIQQNSKKQVFGAPYGYKCKYCGTGDPPWPYPVYRKKHGECSKDVHLKVVCRSLQRQQVSWQPKMLNNMYQEGRTGPQVPEDQDWNFDVVRVKYINLNSIKSDYSLN